MSFGVAHRHRSAPEKPWLPAFGDGLLRPHPYCVECGVVKNVSGDKAKDIGFYINALAEMKRYLERNGGKLADAQIRLIYKELNSVEGFGDAYYMLGSTQRNIFINAVRKYTNLSPSFIEGFL